MHKQEEKGYFIELAVESTGSMRYFNNKIKSESFLVKVVNINKYKKTDANDVITPVIYLMKGMLPEAHLCDQINKELCRMMKTRSLLVRSSV